MHKILRTRMLVMATLGVAAAAMSSTGCSQRDRDVAETKAKTAYEQTKAAATRAWSEVKSFSFAERDKFTAHARSMAADMDAKLSRVRADAADAKASERRREAMAELKSAEADYREKVAALGDATAATWDSAKQNAIAAWDRLEAAYYKARAE